MNHYLPTSQHKFAVGCLVARRPSLVKGIEAGTARCGPKLASWSRVAVLPWLRYWGRLFVQILKVTLTAIQIWQLLWRVLVCLSLSLQ